MSLSLEQEVSNHMSDKGIRNTASQICLVKDRSAQLS